MTILRAFSEFLIGENMVSDVGEEQSPNPLLVTNHFPIDDPDHALVILPYATRRDPLQLVTEEIEKSLRRKDMQVFFRHRGDYDELEEYFQGLLNKIQQRLPYTSASGQVTIFCMYVKNGPFLYEVDRHSRIVYLSNIRLVHGKPLSTTTES